MEVVNCLDLFTYIKKNFIVIIDTNFTGYFERANLPWYLRILDRLVPNSQGDHRDWEAIKSWTKSLVPELTGE